MRVGDSPRLACRRFVVVVLALVTLVASGSGASADGPTYRDAVLADTPAGYWRLGETSGTVAADATANSNNGTYLQAVTLGVPGALSDGTPAARLDGGSGRVSMGDPASGMFDFGTDDFTVEAWVKTSFNDERALIGKRDSSTRYWQVTVTDDGSQSGRLRVNVSDGAVTRQVYGLVRVDDGAWHHVVVLFDRDSGIRFYTDGAPTGFVVAPVPGDLGNAGPLMVGKISGYANFKGDIDEVAVYRGLLSLQRIQSHYYAALSDTAPPRVTLNTPVGGSSTTDTTPTFGGSAGTAIGDSATITIRVFAGTDTSQPPVQTVAATRAADGSYSVEAVDPLALGPYTARAEQSDESGNLGVSSLNAFTVEGGPPPPPPPPPPPADPVLIGAGDIASCGVSGQDEATAAIIDANPEAKVFTLGDNAYPNGSVEEYACYDDSWGRSKNRTYPAVGGHDYATPGAAGYFGYFGAAAGDPAKGYYSYDLGTWHVVVLNSQCSEVGGCQTGSPQEQWLRDDLTAHRNTCTLAYWHEPRFSSGSVHGSHPDMQAFWQALYEHGAELVMSGDDHLYERFLPQAGDGSLDLAYGVTQFVVGTGGYQVLYDFAPTILPNSAARIDHVHGLLKLVLHDSSYDWQFVPVPGQTATDSGGASCHAAPEPPPPPPPPPPPTGYAGVVSSDGPRAYWRLGEASGTGAADQLGGMPGTYQGGVVLGVPGGLTGDTNTAVGFDGGNDRVSMGDPAGGGLDFGAGDFTVEAWVRATANDERAIISKRSYTAGTPYWQATVTDDGADTGRIRINLFDGGVSRVAYGPPVRVDDGAWHHVVIVFDRDTGITITVDGTSRSTAGSFPADIVNDGEFLLGKSPGYSYFKGDLDEVAVYTGILPPARIQAHYAAGRGSG